LALSADRRWYVANFVDKFDTWRLTATFPLLNLAREIFFLVAGANKAERIAEIMDGVAHPATVVAQGPSNVTWLLDEAAARLLSR
jgi:6-phosphogluconolactonase